MAEKALSLVKPDGVRMGLTGKCLEMWERRGLTLIALTMRVGTEAMFTEQYQDRQTYDFWDELLAFLMSGPVVAAAWEGPDANARVRQVVGEKQPLDSLPGSIRGSLPALDPIHSLVHGSRSPEEAASELAIWFPDQFPGPVIAASQEPTASAPYAPGQLVLPDEIVSRRRSEPWRVSPGERGRVLVQLSYGGED